jgi:hypothetical protein
LGDGSEPSRHWARSKVPYEKVLTIVTT